MGTTEDVVEAKVADVTPDKKTLDELSDLEKKIVHQIEYYFGNYNLPKDRFLKEQIKLDDGWVPLETMVKFNRLKSLSTDFKVIADALKKSPSKLMEVSEDGLKIRRTPEIEVPEINPSHREDINSRSVYVKGFPINSTLDQLLEFFKDNCTFPVGNINMRRNPHTKTFKGSVFVTFETKEDAESFMKGEAMKYKDRSLHRETKEAYIKRKEEEYQQRKESKEKKMAEDKKGANDKDEKEVKKDYPKDCILKLTGLSDQTKWEDIKEFLRPHGSVAFVDYSIGKSEAHVRFEEGTSATEVMQKILPEDSKVVKIKDAEVTPLVLEGEDENEFWQKLFKMRSELRSQRNVRPGQKKGGKGRFGGKNKRFNKRGGDNEESKPAKRMKGDSEAAEESEKMDADGKGDSKVPDDKLASEGKSDADDNAATKSAENAV